MSDVLETRGEERLVVLLPPTSGLEWAAVAANVMVERKGPGLVVVNPSAWNEGELPHFLDHFGLDGMAYQEVTAVDPDDLRQKLASDATLIL